MSSSTTTADELERLQEHFCAIKSRAERKEELLTALAKAVRPYSWFVPCSRSEDRFKARKAMIVALIAIEKEFPEIFD